MRLTNTIREAFIRSAMNDVPKVDFQEEVRNLVVKGCLEILPKKVQDLYEDKLYEPYLVSHYVNFYRGSQFRNLYTVIGSLMAPGPGPAGNGNYNFTPETTRKLGEFVKKAEEQTEKLSSLETKLRAIAYGCTTRKALAETLPEFEKYLPAEIDPGSNRSLPAITNVVSEFTEAGWPKDKKA